MEELVKSREDREDKGNSATARRTWRNKLANLEATLVCNRVTKLLSGVECRATRGAKKLKGKEEGQQLQVKVNFSLGQDVESILSWGFIDVSLAIWPLRYLG